MSEKEVNALEEDDLMEPLETLRRHKLGIDMSYLVQHFGEGSFIAPEDRETEYFGRNTESLVSDERMSEITETNGI